MAGPGTVMSRVRNDWSVVWHYCVERQGEAEAVLPGASQDERLDRETAARRGLILWTPDRLPLLGQNLRFRILRAVLGGASIGFSHELSAANPPGTSAEDQQAAEGEADEPELGSSENGVDTLDRPPASKKKPSDQPRQRHALASHFEPLPSSSDRYYAPMLLGQPWDPRSKWRVLEERVATLNANGTNRRLKENRRFLYCQSDTLPAVTTAAFMWHPFTGPDAPCEFYEWLSGETFKPITQGTIKTPRAWRGEGFMLDIQREDRLRFYKNPHRLTAVEAITKWLHPASGGELIRSVYSAGTAHGMTALARYLWETRPSTDTRPWLYLPIGRGQLPDLDLDPSFRSTTARLWAFYHGRDPRTANPDRPGRWEASSISEPQSTEGRLAEIRQRMATKAAVIMIDGYQAVGEENEASLMRLIRDEPLVPLLERLVQPYIDLQDGKGPGIGFAATRILVLGTSKLEGHPFLERHIVQANDPFPNLLHNQLGPILVRALPVGTERESQAAKVNDLLTRSEIAATDTNIKLLSVLVRTLSARNARMGRGSGMRRGEPPAPFRPRDHVPSTQPVGRRILGFGGSRALANRN